MPKATEPTAEELIGAIEKSKLNDKILAILLETLTEVANGYYYEKETLDGSKRIYKKEPSEKALEYLTDRILGKTPVALQGTGDKGQFVFEIINFGGDDDCGKE